MTETWPETISGEPDTPGNGAARPQQPQGTTSSERPGDEGGSLRPGSGSPESHFWPSAPPCLICERKDAERISVHAECIVHKHESANGPAIPRRQEEYAALYAQADGAEEKASGFEDMLWTLYRRAVAEPSVDGFERWLATLEEKP